jgi:hypothetical protein
MPKRQFLRIEIEEAICMPFHRQIKSLEGRKCRRAPVPRVSLVQIRLHFDRQVLGIARAENLTRAEESQLLNGCGGIRCDDRKT